MAADYIGIDSYGSMVSDSAIALLSLKKREKAVTDALLEYMDKHHLGEMDILESIPVSAKSQLRTSLLKLVIFIKMNTTRFS